MLLETAGRRFRSAFRCGHPPVWIISHLGQSEQRRGLRDRKTPQQTLPQLPERLSTPPHRRQRGPPDMDYRQLGGSGFKVPVLSLGTGTFGGGNEFFKAWGATEVAEA